MADFLPRADHKLLVWSNNFAKQVSDHWPALGVREPTVQQLALADAAFTLVMNRISNPSTTTPVAFADKNSARRELEAIIRSVSKQLRGTPTIEDAMLHQLGLRPRAVRRKAVPVPDHAPVVQVVRVTGRRVTIRLRTAHSNRRGKPGDVRYAGVFVLNTGRADGVRLDNGGSGTHHGPNGFRSHTVMPPIFTGQTTLTLQLPHTLSPGSRVSIVACWTNYCQQFGPTSRPAVVRVNYDDAPALPVLQAA